MKKFTAFMLACVFIFLAAACTRLTNEEKKILEEYKKEKTAITSRTMRTGLNGYPYLNEIEDNMIVYVNQWNERDPWISGRVVEHRIYHSHKYCDYVAGEKTPYVAEQALINGYTPCPRCWNK